MLRRPQLSPSRPSRKKRAFSARPFFATVLLVCAIAAASLLLDAPQTPVHPDASRLLRRGVSAQDEECRLVHHARDKCAFVRANCPDEEAGIFSYLQLYYCRLPHAKPFAFAVLVAWLALLFSTIGIAASDFFCVNLSTISDLLGMSESMAGVTFLAFGNGSPDVFSTFAAMKTNSGSLAVGELIGAAGFITAVVAGSMAIVRPFKVDRRSFVRDVLFFIFAAAFSMVFLIDGKLSLWECATMVGFYIAYVLFVLWWHWWHGRRQRKRHVEATARGHYVTPGGEEAEVFEPYHDEEDGSIDDRHRRSHSASVDDLLMLEQNSEYEDEPGFESADEEVRERWLGELNRNMRLSRPRLGERRNTRPPPIRPSLVGALEFRAVLTSLKKSRNIQSMPINLRRYSDDPTFTTAQQQDHMSLVSVGNLIYSCSSSEPKQWDRWLVIVQIFTAPLFVVIIFWANFEIDNPRALIRPVLISLACSLSVLLLLLATTTPDRPPKWRVLLCFVGFVVAIAWISTIANEVVGVLKTLGAILNISDAILGLTVFAVGNSLGDLVADITVARLGFPVMALSACFGGPMLNILLGIGLSGCYMTIKHAETKHEKHPDHPLHFKPFHLDISSTLIVSGATLLVTLLGLLVLVPLRKWRMDRVVGWSLVALWTVSTIGNVVTEALGYGDDDIN
ncbi:sodium calcium exchanger protein [Neofusicoccum parvum]|nr:sodium calcium exchanger protein [Neofusicoccum parvum]